MALPFPFYNNVSGLPPYEGFIYIPVVNLDDFESLEPHRIRIHKAVRTALGAASVRLDLECTICEGLKFPEGLSLNLGECCFIAPNVTLIQPRIAEKPAAIDIGKFTIVGPNAQVAAVRIGNYCEIGHHAKIGERCSIQDGCIIAPYTDLRPDTVCPSGTVWAGTPGLCMGLSPADVVDTVERKCRDLREFLQPLEGSVGGTWSVE
eukprot:Protomagalhaensia_wolfi_Nauph_80__108@NODE_105_length_3692_cov_31_602792_g79_i0_p2_GENE_NODE_105_length_3692_cov_31_602792_g79_i0NODE_105_length_3692_cov_31_602792_g79_i0_p2_ORF_typecomplete_len206_score31_98Hexapep/PF00132_24/10Hexapep/PF00132_24/6e05Hexapep/PF00132_24/5e07Hexapep_2/PF14602_6/0_0014Hexapep_2/PF14602_6/1_9e05DUF5612/PF18462_1/0_21_NODE_105_length_3692_cov_31_602792_g79_i019582575